MSNDTIPEITEFSMYLQGIRFYDDAEVIALAVINDAVWPLAKNSKELIAIDTGTTCKALIGHIKVALKRYKEEQNMPAMELLLKTDKTFDFTFGRFEAVVSISFVRIKTSVVMNVMVARRTLLDRGDKSSAEAAFALEDYFEQKFVNHFTKG